MTRAGALALGLLLAACLPVGVEQAPGAPIGPVLVLDVTNISDRELEVVYEFDSLSSDGSGGGSFGACVRSISLWGEVAGTYSILVEREPLVEADVPPGMPADGYLVVALSIDPDGAARQTAPARWARVIESEERPIPGCG